MKRVVIMGNSGSGKSTLALRLARELGLAHLDLDVVAWEPVVPPARRALDESFAAMAPILAEETWVVEGCYADLLGRALERATRLIFLNPGVEVCIANARARPWEPHKYPSREAQDANLEMLVRWIRDYETRADVFSLRAHRALFDSFGGDKVEVTELAF